MRIGKSGAVTCDFCGEVVVGTPDIIRKRNQEMHFCPCSCGKVDCSCEDDDIGCPGACMMAYLWERFFRDRVTDAAEKEKKAEWKVIHSQVCPACRYRLQKLL